MLVSLVMAVAAAGMLTSCSSAQATECHTQSRASVCLVSVHAGDYKPRASGLKPGTEVEVQVSGKGGFLPVKAGPPVDSSGHWPAGVSSGIVTPKNGSEVITITGISASGAAVKVSFKG